MTDEKKICYNCKHRNLKVGSHGTQCDRSLYQDQSIDLKLCDMDYAERCSAFLRREEEN